jgi:DNA mismatch repair protein MLH3
MKNQILSQVPQGAECLYSGLAIRNVNNLHGTVVHVRDAFYSVGNYVASQYPTYFQQMPVRRLSQPSESRTLDLIRKHVTIAALCHPSVMFTVENTSKLFKTTRIMTVPRVRQSLVE